MLPSLSSVLRPVYIIMDRDAESKPAYRADKGDMLEEQRISHGVL
jgi:hypothetical protein